MEHLTPKQRRFVDEYLVDLNATQAAVRAGYSKRRAAEIGYQQLQKTTMQAAIAARMKAREQRTEITQDRVLKELARIAFFDLRKLYRADGSLKAIHELDDDAAAVLAGVDVVEMADGEKDAQMYTKKTRIPDKVAALSLAMRHLGMLKDRLDVSGSIDIVTALNSARKRLAADR